SRCCNSAVLLSFLARHLRGLQRKRPTRTQCARMTMKAPFGIRLWILLAALVLVAGGTIYGLSTAWHRVQQLEAQLNGSQIESFRLAGEVQRGLLSLNNSMLRYAMLRDSREWEQFERASSDLNHWIDNHDPRMNPKSTLTGDAWRQLMQVLNRV